ncbi:protein quiver [Caerostris extrusa]|uniref:Protein quiver n=1 Tax=Caerostris extrusa TaxID=172846 RepID=A0AAV4WZ76_CAEEX|nr:protein quiver [Caerostris extrusa]
MSKAKSPFRNSVLIGGALAEGLQILIRKGASYIGEGDSLSGLRDDYRFVRGCGWLSSEKESTDCFKRAGTFNVLIQYCSCDTDGCNAAPSILQHSWIGLLASVILSILMIVK